MECEKEEHSKSAFEKWNNSCIHFCGEFLHAVIIEQINGEVLSVQKGKFYSFSQITSTFL